MVPVVVALLLWESRSEYSLGFVHVSIFGGVWVHVWRGGEAYLDGTRLREKDDVVFFFLLLFYFIFSVRDGFVFQDRRVEGNRPAESFICSAINLPSLSLCSFTPPAIYPSFPVAKGPCLFVALVICTNFLCNLFPSQPPTWSSRVRLLKVEPLIPASPLTPNHTLLVPPPPPRLTSFVL